MKSSPDSSNSLYRIIQLLRFILPIAAFLFVVVHQSITHDLLRSPQLSAHFLWQVLPYGTIGPVVVWLALTWFVRWARERDEAEAHLHCLHKISQQAATATEMEEIVDIALHIPEEIIRPAATSLILRENPDGAWSLAGTYGLQKSEMDMLAARLSMEGSDLYCGQCITLSATAHQDCPMHIPLSQADMTPRITRVVCLPLSTERPPLALLNVYLPDEASLSPGMRRVLESMGAVLSVALDHARLRTREIQMLNRMEQASRRQESLAATVGQILSDMATVHHAQGGEVFLLSMDDNQAPTLTPITAWPEGRTHPLLNSTAQRALLEEDTVITTSPQHKEHAVAIPLMAEGLTTGVLALSSDHPFSTSQQSFLQVAASMIALIIRNNQLYGQLERQAVLEERNRLAREFHDGLAQGLGFLNFKIQQVERLLEREQWKAAQEALGELQNGTQNLYTEVRQTIQDLRWFPEDGQRFSERLHEYVLDFGERTGLNVDLDVKGEPRLSPQDEVHLFRIVQEALTNVHKHAQAQHACVRLWAGPEATILEIQDDGTGISQEAPSQDPVSDAAGHFGLRIMRERAEAMGGQLSVRSTPSQGTQLQVTVGATNPLDPLTISTASKGR